MNKVLFLCTGNYFRSRFAEILFNHLATKQGGKWRAFSRALAIERGSGNVGPISTHAVKGLHERGITLDAGRQRFPLQATVRDFEQADIVIALKESEHSQYISSRFPSFTEKVTYWAIDDVGDRPVAESLAEMEEKISVLLQTLDPSGFQGVTPPCRIEV